MEEQLKILIISLVLAASIASATPFAGRQQVKISDAEKIPNVDDLLAVAKSPLEPVTIAMSLPNARNDNDAETTTTTNGSNSMVHDQTSRAVNFVQQEEPESTTQLSAEPAANTTTEEPASEASTTVSSQPAAESTTSEPAPTTSGPPPQSGEVSEVVKSADQPTEAPKVEEKPSSTVSAPVSEPTTTTSPAPENANEPAPVSPVAPEQPVASSQPTTTEAPVSNESSPTTTELPAAEKPKEAEEEETRDLPVEKPAPTTTEATAKVEPEAPSTTTPALEVSSTTLASSQESTTTPEPASTTEAASTITENSSAQTTPSTEAPAPVENGASNPPPEAPKVGDDSVMEERPAEIPSQPAEPAPPAPTSQPASTEAPAETTASSTTTDTPTQPTTVAASSEPPAVPEVSTSPPPLAPSSTEAPPTTSKPVQASTSQPAAEPEGDSKKDDSCNHFPSYDPEELQKVFREETTFKNGTIKGRFTYINFDQRYRLVHYTRLPYGPVKIDLVEELARPKNAGSRAKTNITSSAEIPNAVLQLRNILPNSLFGFPFVGPVPTNNNNHNNQASANNKELTSKDDKSYQYFYSTDTLSTPNLLTPSVPIALLPGQQRTSNRPQQPADTLSQSYYDNLPIESLRLPQHKLQKPVNQEPAKKQQFQYAHYGDSSVGNNQPSSYTYSAQPQPQYQYSPVPISWQNLYSASAAGQQSLLVPPPEVSSKPPATFNQHQHFQAHQPHSHEHFIAPFMFSRLNSQQASVTSDNVNARDLLEQPENRLKLRVKTSKALNQESFGRLAQLKTNSQQQSQQPQEQQQQLNYVQPASYLQSPVYSPAQIRRNQEGRHRQRSGKQHFEVKTAINSNPIVYHVLRSPLGKMYTIDQFNNQPHAMAYDHDE